MNVFPLYLKDPSYILNFEPLVLLLSWWSKMMRESVFINVARFGRKKTEHQLIRFGT